MSNELPLVEQIFKTPFMCILKQEERAILEPDIELPKFEYAGGGRMSDPHSGGHWIVKEDKEHDAMLERWFKNRPRETGCAESDKLTMSLQHHQQITINDMVEIYAIAEVIRFNNVDDLVKAYNILDRYIAQCENHNNGWGHFKIPEVDIAKMKNLISSWHIAFEALTSQGHKDDVFSLLFSNLTDLPTVKVEGKAIELRGPAHCNYDAAKLPFDF